MRVVQFNQVGVCRTVWHFGVGKQFFSSPMDVHDNRLSLRIIFRSLCKQMMQCVIQMFVISIFFKHMLAERMEKVMMRSVGSDMQQLANIFNVMVLA